MADRLVPSLPNLPPTPKGPEDLVAWSNSLHRAISELYRQLAEPVGGLLAAGTPFVHLQVSTPGTADTGNFNVSGTGIVGGNLIAGGDLVPNGNLTGGPSLVASKLDLGTRSMSSTPSGTQNLNRRGIVGAISGSIGYDITHPGSLVALSLTGVTSFTHLIDINHTNTSAIGDSSAIYIKTEAAFGDTAAAISLRNVGVSDTVYIGVEGPAGGTGSGALGIGIDVNRQFGTSNPNSDRNNIGILAINWGDSSNVGTIIQMANADATCLSPLIVGTSNGALFTVQAATSAGHANDAFAVVDSTPAVTAHLTYSGLMTAARFIGPATKLRSATTDVTVDSDTPAAGELLMASSTTVAIWKKLDTTDNGGAVVLQASYPGTQQSGNLNLSGLARFAGQFHARVYLSSATQSINNVTTTVINFNNEVTDVGGMHDNATNNSRITIPTGGDGTYILSCGVDFAPNGTGFRQVRFIQNGATLLALANEPAVTSASIPTRVTLTIAVDLAATDFVEVDVYQDSGGALNVGGTDPFNTWFTATKVN